MMDMRLIGLGLLAQAEADASLLERLNTWIMAHPALAPSVWIAGIALVALVAHLVTRRIVLPLLGKITARSSVRWDEVLLEHGVFHRAAWLVPLIIFYQGLTTVPNLPEGLHTLLARLALCTMILAGVRAFAGLLAAINTIYCRSPISISRPIKGYLQAISIIAHIVAVLLIISQLIGQSPWYLLSGIGAMTAIFMLIFRESLLGLVAGIQLTVNDYVRVNDWIEMPQFGADGDVVDIGLNAVKVLNWDKTVTIIPAHKFLDSSFKNWRSMHEQGGRRIKRSINIDMTTIRFLTEEEVDRLGRFALLKDYIAQKKADIAEFNRQNAGDPSIIPHQRRLTNIGTFRAYVQAYLRSHPMIHQKLTFLVRQLQPTSQGLPLEIYVFVNDTRWAIYEGVQADVFDHLLAILPQFDLRVFQDPTGSDFAKLGETPAARIEAKPHKAGTMAAVKQ